MNTISLICKSAAMLASLFILSGTMATANAADLTVTVDGLRNANGTVRYEVDNSAAAWDNKAKAFATADVKAAMGSVTYTFKNVPPGTYGVGVYQDENDNGKLDTNFLGIPKEGYGFSNNLKLMRKPTFEEAHFDVTTQNEAIVIHLNHVM
jgi:uncharacterized protein (DUF2141 family)